jgi:hypothetical protein
LAERLKGYYVVQEIAEKFNQTYYKLTDYRRLVMRHELFKYFAFFGKPFGLICSFGSFICFPHDFVFGTFVSLAGITPCSFALLPRHGFVINILFILLSDAQLLGICQSEF